MVRLDIKMQIADIIGMLMIGFANFQFIPILFKRVNIRMWTKYIPKLWLLKNKITFLIPLLLIEKFLKIRNTPIELSNTLGVK